MRSTCRSLALLAAIAAALSLPSRADAQLGRFIKKKVTEKVAGEKGQQEAQPQGASNADAAFTEDQVDRYIKVQLAYYADLAAWDAKQKAREAQNAEYQRKMMEQSACMQSGFQMAQAANATAGPGMAGMMNPDMQRFVMAMRDKIASMTPAQADEFQKQVKVLEERGKAAQARHDTPEMARISQDFEKLVGVKLPMLGAAEQAQMQSPEAEKTREMRQAAREKLPSCGEAPQMPAAALEQPAPKPDYDAYIARAGLAALAEGQMREMLIGYARWLETPEGRSGKPGNPLLDNRRDDVKKVMALWKEYEHLPW